MEEENNFAYVDQPHRFRCFNSNRNRPTTLLAEFDRIVALYEKVKNESNITPKYL